MSRIWPATASVNACVSSLGNVLKSHASAKRPTGSTGPAF